MSIKSTVISVLHWEHILLKEKPERSTGKQIFYVCGRNGRYRETQTVMIAGRDIAGLPGNMSCVRAGSLQSEFVGK